MNAKSPKNRRTVRISRKEKEFELLLRQAARLQASKQAAQRKRAASKAVA
jgi:hypothetical protein